VSKVRVSALAKELGVTSKVLLERLNGMGEYVKSASSTIETPVVRRYNEKFPTEAPKAEAPAAAKKAPATRCAPASGVVGRIAGRHSYEWSSDPARTASLPFCRTPSTDGPGAAHGCIRSSRASISPSVAGRSGARCAAARPPTTQRSTTGSGPTSRSHRPRARTESGFDADEHPMSTQR
jgi:translation initiation factor IF-2